MTMAVGVLATFVDKIAVPLSNVQAYTDTGLFTVATPESAADDTIRTGYITSNLNDKRIPYIVYRYTNETPRPIRTTNKLQLIFNIPPYPPPNDKKNMRMYTKLLSGTPSQIHTHTDRIRKTYTSANNKEYVRLWVEAIVTHYTEYITNLRVRPADVLPTTTRRVYSKSIVDTQLTDPEKIANILHEQGIVVEPVFGHEERSDIFSTLANVYSFLPEYSESAYEYRANELVPAIIKPTNGSEYKRTWIGDIDLKFPFAYEYDGIIPTASSVHNRATRTINRDIFAKTFPTTKLIANHIGLIDNSMTHVSQMIDGVTVQSRYSRLLEDNKDDWRYAARTEWAITSSSREVLFPGFLNLGDENEYVECIPGSHRQTHPPLNIDSYFEANNIDENAARHTIMRITEHINENIMEPTASKTRNDDIAKKVRHYLVQVTNDGTGIGIVDTMKTVLRYISTVDRNNRVIALKRLRSTQGEFTPYEPRVSVTTAIANADSRLITVPPGSYVRWYGDLIVNPVNPLVIERNTASTVAKSPTRMLIRTGIRLSSNEDAIDRIQSSVDSLKTMSPPSFRGGGSRVPHDPAVSTRRDGIGKVINRSFDDKVDVLNIPALKELDATKKAYTFTPSIRKIAGSTYTLESMYPPYFNPDDEDKPYEDAALTVGAIAWNVNEKELLVHARVAT